MLWIQGIDIKVWLNPYTTSNNHFKSIFNNLFQLLKGEHYPVRLEEFAGRSFMQKSYMPVGQSNSNHLEIWTINSQ